MDQGGAEGIRGIPGRGPVSLPRGADNRGGIGAGVFEIALLFHGNAFRVIYAVQMAEEIWAVHAFQKKSTQGIKTPKREIDLIKDRLKKRKEMLR